MTIKTETVFTLSEDELRLAIINHVINQTKIDLLDIKDLVFLNGSTQEKPCFTAVRFKGVK